jgi:hypothetical protein
MGTIRTKIKIIFYKLYIVISKFYSISAKNLANRIMQLDNSINLSELKFSVSE